MKIKMEPNQSTDNDHSWGYVYKAFGKESMKFKISLVLNLLLLAAVGVLGFRQVSEEIGDYYYRKMVGVVCSGAAEKMKNGDIDLVKAVITAIPSDPSYEDILSAGRKLEVIQ